MFLASLTSFQSDLLKHPSLLLSEVLARTVFLASAVLCPSSTQFTTSVKSPSTCHLLRNVLWPFLLNEHPFCLTHQASLLHLSYSIHYSFLRGLITSGVAGTCSCLAPLKHNCNMKDSKQRLTYNMSRVTLSTVVLA